jgi:lipopolysaccharide transport system permease protein
MLAGPAESTGTLQFNFWLMNNNKYIDDSVTVIEPVAPLGFIDLRELSRYRDLIYFMIWRTIKVAYAQSVGGFAWAIIQPAMQVLVFSIVFGKMLAVDTGDIPYPLFATVAIVPWGYMASTLGGASSGLVKNTGMLGKIYFPRIIFLITPIVGGLVSFSISLVLIIAVMIFYQVTLTAQMLLLPLLFLLMMMTPMAMGLWLSSLAIRFRDVQIMMSYFMRLLIYLVPVMYPSEQIPAEFRIYYIFNPFVGVIEGFRSALLGMPIMWDSLLVGLAVSLVLLISGGIYFRRMERIIVDVI